MGREHCSPGSIEVAQPLLWHQGGQGAQEGGVSSGCQGYFLLSHAVSPRGGDSGWLNRL